MGWADRRVGLTVVLLDSSSSSTLPCTDTQLVFRRSRNHILRHQRPTVTVYHSPVQVEGILSKFVAPSKTLAKTPSKSISDRKKNEGNSLLVNAARIVMRLDSMAKGTQRVPFSCEYRNRHVHPISSHVTKSILLRAGIA